MHLGRRRAEGGRRRGGWIGRGRRFLRRQRLRAQGIDPEPIDHGGVVMRPAVDDGQDDAEAEEDGGEDRCRARQKIAGASRGQKAGRAAAGAERAAL